MNRQTIEALKQSIDKRVPQKLGKGGASFWYVPGHYVIDRLNQIFGFDGWGLNTTSDLVAEEHATTRNGKKLWRVTYRADARILIVGTGVVREDVGVASAALPLRGEAHEMARKSAATDAMKRAARTFGSQFGNELYGDNPLRFEEGAYVAEEAPQEPRHYEPEYDALPEAEAKERALKDAQPPAKPRKIPAKGRVTKDQRQALKSHYGRLGLGVEQLEAFLGHRIALLTPEERDVLLWGHTRIAAGELTWAQWDEPGSIQRTREYRAAEAERLEQRIGAAAAATERLGITWAQARRWLGITESPTHDDLDRLGAEVTAIRKEGPRRLEAFVAQAIGGAS